MSTKQNPGPFDCYAKLALGEPYFVLRGKDPIAPALVELWAAIREAQHGAALTVGQLLDQCRESGSYSKLTEARKRAADMRRWRAAELSPDEVPY